MKPLKVAIQKQGRLSEKSLELLRKCDFQLSTSTRKLKASASNFPLEVLFLRDDDIPHYVEQGIADIGIVGENELLEKQKNVTTLLHLGFAKCRVSLAIPREEQYNGLSYFEGKTIATSYPVILQQFLQENKINATIESIGGSVEITTGIGLAQGILDIVSTGSTLVMNGLKEVETVLTSQAVLIGNVELQSSQEKLLQQLLFRINATQLGSKSKYILLNTPNESISEITNLLPGMKSPTILPLAQEGWSSLHSVVKESEFWDVIDQLKQKGAEGILVIPIETMVV